MVMVAYSYGESDLRPASHEWCRHTISAGMLSLALATACASSPFSTSVGFCHNPDACAPEEGGLAHEPPRSRGGRARCLGRSRPPPEQPRTRTSTPWTTCSLSRSASDPFPDDTNSVAHELNTTNDCLGATNSRGSRVVAVLDLGPARDGGFVAIQAHRDGQRVDDGLGQGLDPS